MGGERAASGACAVALARGTRRRGPRSPRSSEASKPAGIGNRDARNEYGPEFAPGYRADAQLGTVLNKEGVETLDQLLKKK